MAANIDVPLELRERSKRKIEETEDPLELRERSKRKIEETEDGIMKQILKVDNLIPKTKQGQLSTYITAEFRRHIVAARIALEESTGKSKGYGFIRFDSNSVAERCLARCQRRNKNFQLSWADDLRDVPEDILQAPQQPQKLPPTSSKMELPKLYDNWPSNLRDGNQTIRFDNLEPWVDIEDVHLFIHSTFRDRIRSCLLKENDETLESEGYCFVQFASWAVAACFLEAYNGKQISGTNMTYQLSWAPFRMYIDKRPHDEEMEDSIDKEKKDICPAHTMSKVAVDPNEECDSPPHSMSEGVVDPPKEECDSPLHTMLEGAVDPTDKDCPKDTIFISAVDPNFKIDEVLQIFSKFGPLACVQLNTSRGCGLVQFKAREAAQYAMQEVQRLVHINKIGFIGWARSEEMQGKLQGKPNVFFSPILSQCSYAFHSCIWGGQGNPGQSSFLFQSSALGDQGKFKFPLSGCLGPPLGLNPVPLRYAFGYDSSGISRVAPIFGSVSRTLRYHRKTTGAPMASRVDAPCSAESQGKTNEVDK